ncbi:MAG: hypoxanthine phosphoribosyltransferase [Chloroflexota bacterium]|jgi:hypoxanthine phosphoribosyltransferase
MDKNIERVLITEEEIQKRVRQLGEQLAQEYTGRNLLLLGVLKGAVVFMVDLARAIDLPLQMDFMAVSSYGASTQSSGVVRILKDLDSAVDGRDILVVEDIIDTGLTLRYILENLSMRNPASVKVCALLVKEKSRPEGIDPDYVGFYIPDEFVVGYGLDYAEIYRNLPYIGILRKQSTMGD